MTDLRTGGPARQGKFRNVFDQIDEYTNSLQRYLKPIAKTKKFKVEEGEFVNEFTVSFYCRRRSDPGGYCLYQKVNPMEEQINFLRVKLKLAIVQEDWVHVKVIGEELDKLTRKPT